MCKDCNSPSSRDASKASAPHPYHATKKGRRRSQHADNAGVVEKSDSNMSTSQEEPTVAGNVKGFSSASTAKTSPLPQLTCLLVEDNQINQQVLRLFLSRLGVDTIDCVENGKDAFDKAMKRKYNIIFMDIMMPVMDGIQSTRLIRSMDGPNKDTVIVAVSAMGRSPPNELEDAGFDDYLPKPFTRKDFDLLINKWAFRPSDIALVALMPPMKDGASPSSLPSGSITASIEEVSTASLHSLTHRESQTESSEELPS